MIEGFQRMGGVWKRPKGFHGPRPAESYRAQRRNAARGVRKARRAVEREMKNFPTTAEDYVDVA